MRMYDDDIIIGGGDEEEDEMEKTVRLMNEGASILDDIPVIEEEDDEEEYDFSEPITIGGYDEDEDEDEDDDDFDDDDDDEDDFDEDEDDDFDDDDDDNFDDDEDDDFDDDEDDDFDDDDEDDDFDDDDEDDDFDEDDDDDDGWENGGDDEPEETADEVEDEDDDDGWENGGDDDEDIAETPAEDIAEDDDDDDDDDASEAITVVIGDEAEKRPEPKKTEPVKKKAGSNGLPEPVVKPRDLTKVREAKQKAKERAMKDTAGDESEFRKEFLVTASPHLHCGETTRLIMQDVIISLMPAALVSIVYFGWRAALVILTCVISCVVSEYICRRVMKRRQTIGDYSAVVTGILLAFCLPPEINPLFAAIGSIVAIVVVKQMFGGIGMNFANPAATARIVLMLSFPVAMTTWSRPFFYLGEYYDAVATPTPLAAIGDSPVNMATTRELLFGFHQGCLGEVCAVALIIGGLYLIVRGIITWHIPACFIATVMLFALITGQNPIYHVLSGGVLLGAFFMATDYVTSPSNKWGKVIFGVGCGLLTMLIRVYGSMTEGVSFAILLMNILSPHIEKLTTPKFYGEEGKKA